MNVSELQQIADSRLKGTNTYHSRILPRNSFSIAYDLHLRMKNSIECLEDFKEKYPLDRCNAIYALCKGEYTIYYDEKYPYKNFAIAHEIAHHLLRHTTDGVDQHHDANLLAAIIVAPKELILTHGIRNVPELSEQCMIPIETATEYWNALGIQQEISTDDYLKQIIFMTDSIMKMLNNVSRVQKGGNAQ